ncbi:hypothetical protein N9O21_01890 [Rhodobacteraceae bacterium]|nr:hypothetical protein [Paracoccaceae bacterium]
MKLNFQQAYNIGEALIDAAESANQSGQDQLVLTIDNGNFATRVPNPDGALEYDPWQNFAVQAKAKK